MVGAEQIRSFPIDISIGEYWKTEEVEVDAYTIRVYSLEMILIEKLRAICQQLPEYGRRKHPASRSRDFFDIHTIREARPSINLLAPENRELFSLIFGAKDVPLFLLSRISAQQVREFHRESWKKTVEQVVGPRNTAGFDYYFEEIAELVETLEPLWDK